ncbi:MAG: OmpA family protein [Bacteroidetes bacterium]|nr:MAG: OmpA family protein [Bacteroidota bacterium]
MKKLLPLFIFLASSLILFAQQDLTLYNTINITQSSRVNPSLKPDYKFYIGLPVISSNYFLLSNSSFTYHDFYKKRSDDSVTIDINNTVNKLHKTNFLKTSFNTDLISFGFKMKKNYFTVNITEHINFAFLYSKDLINLIDKGNGPYIGQQLDFVKTGFDATHYRDYSIGWAYDLNEKWTTGIRIKYLYGMENYSSTAGDFGLYTASDDYSLEVPTDVVINTSSPDNSEEGYEQFDTSDSGVRTKNIKKYLFSRANKGFAADLGATYRYNETWNFSASIIDLGYIKWKEDVKNFKTVAGKYEFSGVDLIRFINDTTANLEAVLDSIGETFKTSETSEGYTTYLPTHVYLGANYIINDKSFAGALVHTEFFKKTIQPSVTLSYNLKVGRHLSTSLSYSYLNHTFDNVGAGLAVNVGALQLYTVTDNIIGLIAPLDARNSHIHFGFNLIFGRPKKDRDKDKVTDKKDKCPDIPGLVKLDGCPDKDGDGVADNEDKCPDIAGLKDKQGCPDTDGDGIIDIEDQCPTDSGLVMFFGCPDTDMDSIPDPQDSCITEKGLAINNGCPDTDGDGLIDKLDSCVLVPGPSSNNGCPVVEKVEVKPSKPVKIQLSKEDQAIINKVFSNLEFESGKSVIRSTSYLSLEELIKLLNRKPTFRLLIEGHTDNVGSAALNMRLSLSRAEAVKTYLSDRGIDGERIIAKGYGLTQPVAPNTTAQGRQKNRRVEFTILE